jgi:putative ABC transport system permease protein
LWRADVHDLLKTSAGASGSSHRLRGRGVLVAAELGIAIVLLAGAGLMLKSFWRLTRMPEGFVPENILSMRITFSGSHYDSWPSKETYTEGVLRRVRALPQVTFAGVEAGSLTTSVHVGNGTDIGGVIRAVSPGYLRSIGVPLLRGDWPVEGNLSGVVVNEAFAREAGGDVLGRVAAGSILNDTIIGVLSDFKTQQLDASPLPEIYMPYQRFPMIRSIRVLIHADGGANVIVKPVREILTQVDSTQPAYEFETLDQALAGSVAPRRFQLFLLVLFASSAILLAVIGIHGVMTWSVAQRIPEIGVRMALGARRHEIVGLIVWQGMRLALVGIGAGLVASAGLTRLIANLLYDVKPNDAATFAAVALAMAAVALIACWMPALRAARTDPAIALRRE